MKSLATFHWQEFLSISSGESVSHHRPFSETAVDTDTRTIGPGSFFVPIVGTKFNGHDFIEQAYTQGAEGAFVSTNYLEAHPDLKRFPNLIAVNDTLETYLALARFHRHRCNAKVVAITGSSGKTTTKEMLFTMIETVLGSAVQKSEKNFNNEIGVSMTLLNLAAETEVLILEMGMRGLGQIKILSDAANPDIGIITNIGPAHIGLLGSLEAIAKAKCEIFAGMDSQTSFGIINGDDSVLTREVGKYWNGCIESFSLHEVEDIHRLSNGNLTFQYEEITFQLGLPGVHNVLNTLACIKACERLGISLKKVADALADFEAGGGRWDKSPINDTRNLWMINDAYNANPTSMKVALAAFIDTPMPGLRKVAIIGGMAELGGFSEHYHREIGEWLNAKGGLDGLIVIGEEAEPLAKAILPDTIPTFQIQQNAEAVSLIQQHWSQDAVFFLKASRSFHLEEIAELLKPSVTNPHVIPS